MKNNVFFVKVLKKLHILEFFNLKLKSKHKEKTVIVPMINGFGLASLLLKEEWLDTLISTFVSEEDSVIDVGVNLGQSLIRFKTKYPDLTYLGFEPNSTCVSYVQRLVSLNGFTKSKVYNVALTNEIGTFELEKDSLTDSRASLISSLRPNYFTHKEHVLTINYDALFLNNPIQFVKIDVEGAELEVITGMQSAIKKWQPIIACEVLDSHSSEAFDFTQNRANQLVALLDNMDYGIIRLKTNFKEQIIAYDLLDAIELKQWTKESSYSNDYLFFPKKQINIIKKQMNSTISK